MTDEEILKAFHLCNTDTDCDNSDCPYKDMISGCIPALNNDITSRFTELKAENAALRERLEKSYAKDTYDWAKDAGERLLEQVILKGQGWRRL